MPTSQPITNNQVVFQQNGYRLTKLWSWQVKSISRMTNNKDNKLLKVLLTGKYFYGGVSTIITPQGERLFADDFNYLSDCADWHYESKYIKVARPNQGYGLLDHQGKRVLDTIYDSLGTPIDNQVNGSRNGKKYTIDLTTHKEMPIKNGKDYQRLGYFSEGLCKVSTLPRMDSFGEYEKNGLAYHSDFDEIAGCWGFINRQGDEVVAPEFIYANDFEGGIAIVCKGKWCKDPKWDNECNQGRYWTDTELWGAIDTEGNIAIPFIFDEINCFSDWSSNEPISTAFKAHIGGWKEGHWGVIDKQGNWFAEPIFEDLGYWYDNGVFDFYDKNKWHEEALIGLYDINQQKVIFEPKYTDVDLNGDGTFDAEYLDEQGQTMKQTLNFDGSIAAPKTPYSHMPAYIKLDESHIGKHGDDMVIVHDQLQQDERYFKIIEQDEKRGLCTRFGQIVLPIIYRSMFVCADNHVICQDDSGWQCFEIGTD